MYKLRSAEADIMAGLANTDGAQAMGDKNLSGAIRARTCALTVTGRRDMSSIVTHACGCIRWCSPSG